MLMDSLNLYSEEQAVTASAASTNVIDHGAAGDALGHELYLHILIEEDFATATSVTFSLQTDDNASFSSATTLWTSGAIVIATLVDGYKVATLRVPKGLEQYSRVYYTIGGSNATAGKVTSFLSPSVEALPAAS